MKDKLIKELKSLGRILWIIAATFWLSYIATFGAITAGKHNGVAIAIGYREGDHTNPAD